MRVAATIVGLLTLAGCVSSQGEAPAWFSERQAEAEGGFPSLRDVPRSNIANTDAAHWAQVERELVAAGQDLKTNPRAAPASQADVQPSEFLNEAREDLEEARQAHPD
jgi:hypothetical protein